MAPFSHLLLLFVTVTTCTNAQLNHHYDSIFSFGDSLTDTGNAAILPATAGGLFTRLPYAQTYFRRPWDNRRLALDFIAEVRGETATAGGPNGRVSDGRLIIDFIADSLEVPQPTPYLAGETAEDFRNGVNFAVSGATALGQAFLNSRGIKTYVPVSLSNQTTWFNTVLQLLASSRSCNEKEIMASSLFYFGEIGFNDYSFALLNNGTVAMAATLVPHIIAVVRSALLEVIRGGAKTVVVTGMMPMGCVPEILAMYPTTSAGDYDHASGCITVINGLAMLHNRAMVGMIRQLRRAHPGTAVHYADLYHPLIRIISSPRKYGFGDRPLAACCGGGAGPYNFNFTYFCGVPGSTVCVNPSQAISWDGIHYTEAANRFVADAMLRAL